MSAEHLRLNPHYPVGSVVHYHGHYKETKIALVTDVVNRFGWNEYQITLVDDDSSTQHLCSSLSLSPVKKAWLMDFEQEMEEGSLVLQENLDIGLPIDPQDFEEDLDEAVNITEIEETASIAEESVEEAAGEAVAPQDEAKKKGKKKDFQANPTSS